MDDENYQSKLTAIIRATSQGKGSYDRVNYFSNKVIKGAERYLIVVLTILCMSGLARADAAFRCGTHLVSIGDTRDEVTHHCGKPTSIDSWEEERVLRDFRTYRENDPRTERDEWNREPFLVKTQVKIELWTFNLGFNRLVRYLKFENGILKEITTGGKGYGR